MYACNQESLHISLLCWCPWKLLAKRTFCLRYAGKLLQVLPRKHIFGLREARMDPFGGGGQASSEARVASSESAALGGGGACRTPSGRYGSSGPWHSGAMPLGRIRARCFGWYPAMISSPPSILERATMSGVTAGNSPGPCVSEKSFGKFEIEL